MIITPNILISPFIPKAMAIYCDSVPKIDLQLGSCGTTSTWRIVAENGIQSHYTLVHNLIIDANK
jgi:hypothetical protein